MKKAVLLAAVAGTALVLAGCNQGNQGGASDQYGTGGGTGSYNRTNSSSSSGGMNNNSGSSSSGATSSSGQ